MPLITTFIYIIIKHISFYIDYYKYGGARRPSFANLCLFTLVVCLGAYEKCRQLKRRQDIAFACAIALACISQAGDTFVMMLFRAMRISHFDDALLDVLMGAPPAMRRTPPSASHTARRHDRL